MISVLASAPLEVSAAVGQLLLARGFTIALAESCTGGLLASTLTDVAGSSAYVLGGVVSYSNEAKMKLLGVQESTLLAYGAVSPQTAAEMAQGARRLFGSDLAIAVTGIAGPGGGTPEKPVGLVYLHLAAQDAGWGERHVWPYDRVGNKLASVGAGLGMVGRFLGERLEIRDWGLEVGGWRSEVGGRRSEVGGRMVVVEGSWREGKWRVRAVWLDGRRREVVGQGRQGQEADGTTIVMIELADGARVELRVDVGRGEWRVGRVWGVERVA